MYRCPLAEDAELRPLEIWHAEELAACVESAREHLASWTLVATRVHDVASARRLLSDYAQHRARDTGHYHGIWHHGRLVGAAMLRTFDQHHHVCELGAWLVPEARGHGLATRAHIGLVESHHVLGHPEEAWTHLRAARELLDAWDATPAEGLRERLNRIIDRASP